MINTIFLFIAGGIAGLMAGLLGIGGATIMVPVYLYYFKLNALFPLEQQFHMAIGCSLAVILISALVATISNYKHHLIEYKIAKIFLPGLGLGIILGTLLSKVIPALVLKKLFSIFLIVLMLSMFKNNSQSKQQSLSTAAITSIAILVGMLNALFGIAGGIIITPVLVRMGVKIKRAISTSIFLSIPISLFGNISLNLSSNYFLIDWQVVLPTALASTIFTPLGSKLGRLISSDWLKKLFAIFLLLIALEMLTS